MNSSLPSASSLSYTYVSSPIDCCATQIMVRERLKRPVAPVVPDEVGTIVVVLEQVDVDVAVEVEELRDVGVAGPGHAPDFGFLREPQLSLVD